MDAERYARIRETFLAADDLPEHERETFVRTQAGDDHSLAAEVLELLSEHDPEAAQIEGHRKSEHGKSSATSETASTSKRVTRASDDSTKRLSQQTHAQPRFPEQARRPEKPPRIAMTRTLAKRQPSSILPLALLLLLVLTLVGWWLHHGVVDSLRSAQSAATIGSASSAAQSLGSFLRDESEKIHQWSQDPRVHESVISLVQLARENGDAPSAELTALLRKAPQADTILAALKDLSASDTIKFVVWNRAGNTLATWLPDRADFGGPISMTVVEQLSHTMRGETVIYGPARLSGDIDGFSPETTLPVMAVIVPIRNEQGRVEAAMLVRGTGMYERLNRALYEGTECTDCDTYLVSKDGIMLSHSKHAVEAAQRGLLGEKSDELSTLLRVTDPGEQRSGRTQANLRHGQPLTTAAAGIVLGSTGASTEPYRNYAGESVIGAWHYLDRYEMGVVVERDDRWVTSPASPIRWSFAGLGLFLCGSMIAMNYWQCRRSVPLTQFDPLAQYEIGAPLGTGGMGVVFRAKHRNLGRPTALKVLRHDRQDPDDLLRFDREARVAAALDSPHIVTIYDYGRTLDGEFFAAMQLLRGLTLYEVVARGGPQPIGRVLCIMRQVCDALLSAHQSGLLHRDIKPQNIMLSLDLSVGDWAIVFDFGLAKPLAPVQGMYQTSEAIWAGTPMYMAPERFRDPTTMDLRSDLYSLGCVAYFMLSGRPPFSECDPESLFALIISHEPISLQTHLGKPVPEEIELFVRRCMAKSADHRFASAQELGDAIDELRAIYPWSIQQARAWWNTNGEHD